MTDAEAIKAVEDGLAGRNVPIVHEEIRVVLAMALERDALRARVAELERERADLSRTLEYRDDSRKHLKERAERGEADAARLREALRDLKSAVSAHLTRGEDETPGQWTRAWAQALAVLASAPSTEPRGAYMRVAEAVRETCARHLRMSPRFEGVLTTPNDNGVLGRAAQDLENLDLAAVVAKALEVGT